MPISRQSTLATCLLSLLAFLQFDSANGDEYRVTAGLQVLYDFSESDGNVVKDRSESDSPINLKIGDNKAVTRIEHGLQIVKPTLIKTDKPPGRLMDAVRNSGELTMEAWVRPDNTKQAGPARLITISKNSSERNVTLGQDGDRFDVRLRTTSTSTNGLPSVASPGGSVTKELTHIVYTHAKNGSTQIFINGKKVADRKVEGNLTNWDKGAQLGFVDEHSGGRPWLGTLHLVAIYSKALSKEEVAQNFTAGPNGKPSPELIAQREQRAAARHFETSVAPLLAKHCVECHDSATHENGLNLARKATAFAGGENGKVILPGKSAESPLWASVESDSMPHDRPPLSAAEKTTLKKWIDDGAVWTLEQIDPAIYVHDSKNQNWVRRLTIDEYIETVRAAVGVDIEKEARKRLPRDLRADGFSNTAYNLNVDFKHVDAYAQLAEVIVSRMDVKPFVTRFSKKRKFTDKDMAEVIEAVGKWLLRGPVSKREVIAYRGITTTVASAGGTFDEAMSFVIEGMLQSPRFLYRVENQRGGGTVAAVNDYELASRLSYIIWGGPPDAELMKAADNGELDESGLQKQMARMLKDERAVQQSQRFVSDWLNLGRLNNLSPNAKRFPKWNAELAEDMRQETLAYFEEVVWEQNKPLTALLNAPITFATPKLAEFYGLEQQTADTSLLPRGEEGGRRPDEGAARQTARYQIASLKPSPLTPALSPNGETEELQRYDVSKVPGRGGLLTHGSVLTVGGDDASMVTRGLLVMHELLRGVVKDPPPCVDTTPIPTKAGLTQRSIAMQRLANPSCGGCHARFEPLAFGLEKFNGIGAYHDKDEHGNALRDDGEILFPGSKGPVKFYSSQELMDLLAGSDRVSQTLTWKVTQFALGRPLVAEDAATVDMIHKQAQKNGGTWPALITAIIGSDLVQKTRMEL